MHRHPRSALTALTALSVLALAACAPAEGDTADEALVFAFPPGTDDPEQLAQVEPVSDHIAEATGREIVTESPADYMGVVEALRQGHVDVALLSPFATAIGQQAGGLDVGLVWEATDDPASVLLTRADSGIETVADVEGRQVAFVDPGSTTGHFMPRALLKEEGLEAGTDYEMTFAGGHDSAALALAQGGVDVAATSAMLVGTLTEAGVIDPEEVVVLAESGPIPVGVTIVFSEDLDERTRTAVVERLPELVEGDEALTTLLGEGEAIADPDAEVFAPLLEVAESVGLELEDIR
ncbi:phosphate/phosphite/phosphonate ABC transporter substrate-binding protein [Nocardiopsis dassonvillei]|uniref:phosphate/phosphite/phosphonate ABC transporter substrate-binding protein n=1 Tax=Nocardiopsis dassonvillei TaxID=2014 RepID=UPI00200D6F9F|nr:phosphate/phosphite/phosphonate ABC transporter substrate-binding protein [Nocardiopsis dassonvillei]MCK9870569.1 phosphate/phosphite/phosphonate ABC transporter substrate-binding protein [Nocardiopsis dassonvillei]